MKFIIKLALMIILMPMSLLAQDMIDLELTKRIKNPVTFNVLENDFNGGNSAAIIFGPSHGELVSNGGGSFTYTPDGTEETPYQELVTYEVCHQNDPEDCQFVDIRIVVEGDTGPMFFACEDAKFVPAYTSFNAPQPAHIIDVLANDVDVNPSSLSIVLAPIHGTLLIQNNQVIYYPELYYQGIDEFLYTINSADGSESDQIKVTVVVGNTNNLIPVRDCAYIESSLTIKDDGDLCYVIVVENLGPDDATGVEVYDQLPSGVSYLNNSTSTGFYSSNSSTWNIGSIGVGDVEELEICVAANQLGDFVNVAQVSAADQEDVDSDPNNDDGDQSEDDENSATITIEPYLIDLELTYSSSNSTVKVDDNFCYTVSIANLGPDDATGVEVLAELPSGVSYVNNSASTGFYSSASTTWTIGNIPVGGNEELEICVIADQVGSFTNVAQVSAADQQDVDSTPNNDSGNQSEDDENSASVTIEPDMIDLWLTYSSSNSTVKLDDNFCYTVTIGNLGPDDATGVEVLAELPSGVSYVNNTASTGLYSSASSTWFVGNIPVGGNEDLEICVTADQLGSFVNVAEVSAADQQDVDSSPNNDNGDQSEDDENSASVTIEPDMIDLELNYTVANISVGIDEQFCYMLEITNLGPDDATGVEVLAPISNQVSYVNNTASTGSYSSTSSNWFIGDISVGVTEQLEICVVADSFSEFDTFAQVINADQIDTDSLPNNDDGDHSEDDEDSITITIEPELNIDLSLNYSGPSSIVNVGDEFCYLLAVENAGPGDATGVEVLIELPVEVSYESNTASTGSYSSASSTWVIGSMPSASIEQLVICVIADQEGNFMSIAQISAANQLDSDSTPSNDDGDQSEDDEDSALVSATTMVTNSELFLNLKALLKGPYDGSLMNDDLRDNNLIPLEEPYSNHPNFTHSGSEQTSQSVLNSGGPNAIVDWVLVELRSKNDPTIILNTRAALIERDGDIVDENGDSPISFISPSDDYYVAVRHRNHLGVMTDQAVDLSNTTTIDFTDPNQATWGTNAQFADGNTMLMWSGNSNSDDNVILQGINNDTNPIFFDVLLAPMNMGNVANYIYSGYFDSDLNLDGEVIFQGVNNDTNVIFFNVLSHPGNGGLIANFIINQQLP